jgi:hypothetical protein
MKNNQSASIEIGDNVGDALPREDCRMTTSEALKVGFYRRRCHGGVRSIANEAEYSLTIPASRLFLKNGSTILSYLLRSKLAVRGLFQVVEGFVHLGDFCLKCGYSILHFLAVHGECDRFGVESNSETNAEVSHRDRERQPAADQPIEQP